MGKEKNPIPNQNPTHSTSFSPDGRYFAALFPESTLKVWDTSSGEIVADWNDPDSAAVYSCTACSNGGKKSKKVNVLLVAVGTSNGDVLAVDVFANKKIWSNSSCHSGEVVSIHFSKDGEVIYTAGADGVLSELSSENGEPKSTFKASKKPITSLSISHDEKFAGVASKISRLISLDGKTELVKIPSDFGHAQLISLSDNDKVALASYDSKEIQICDFDPENRSIKCGAVLHMKSPPKILECNSNLVLSVSNKGIVNLWNLEQNAMDEAAPSKIEVKLERGKKEGRIGIISAKISELNNENKCAYVLVAYYMQECLKFENVEVKSWGEEIYIKPEEKVNNTESNGEMAKADLQKERVKKRAAPNFDSEKEETVEKAHESFTNFNTNEPTMAEKLASLDLAIREKENGNEKEKGERDRSAKPPSADSVHVLIRQALHADDQSLLLDCIYTRDEKVIAKSISLLTPADVIKLMKFFVLMIQSRGAIMACVIPWLRSLISLKASSIVSHDSSLALLNSLYQLIDSRVSTFGSALKLSTCIDYHFTGIDDDEADEEAPPIIYEEKDSDEEEEASGDAMETDEEELGNDINAPQYSDGSEVMSD